MRGVHMSKTVYTNAKKVIDEYFSSIAVNDNKIRYITFQENDVEFTKKGKCYTAVIEYDCFKQYINFYEKYLFTKNVVNSVFEFDGEEKLFCFFVDVFNAVNSNDLDFYTYGYCKSSDDIKAALNNIVCATDKYFNCLERVANNSELQKLIIDDKKAYEEDNSFLPESFIDTFDHKWFKYKKLNSDTFFGYETFFDELKSRKKKGLKLNLYEQRAYNYMSEMSRADIRQAQSSIKKKKYDNLLMLLPYIFGVVIFGSVFGVLANYIMQKLFVGYYMENIGVVTFFFVFLGVIFGAAVVGLCNIDVLFWKLFYKKETARRIYDVAKEDQAPTWLMIVTLAVTVIFVFFVSVFAISGIGIGTENVLYKDNLFSENQYYSYESLEVAVITNSVDGSEFAETAYAFYIDNEWYEYGVPNKRAKALLESKLKEYNINIIDAYDVEQLNGGINNENFRN